MSRVRSSNGSGPVDPPTGEPDPCGMPALGWPSQTTASQVWTHKPGRYHRDAMNSQKRTELVIEGAPARRLGSALAEVWVFRGTIRAFAERDIRVKYKQSVLGVAWAVIQPLGFMVVFTLTIGRIADVATGDVPYAAFSLSALVPWTFLSTAVSFGANGVLERRSDGAACVLPA